jgi:hypothetical protein
MPLLGGRLQRVTLIVKGFETFYVVIRTGTCRISQGKGEFKNRLEGL